MDEAQAAFTRTMLSPIIKAFAKEITAQRANGATEADIQGMLDRVETTNRPVMQPEQFQFVMTMFREAAQPG